MRKISRIQRIKDYIEHTRRQLQKLISMSGNLTDSEIITLSRRLDRALNIYYRMISRKKRIS